MTEKNDKALVLRTVYLNQDRDEELRKIAFEYRMSKGDLIRRLIDFALQHKKEFEKSVGSVEAGPEGIPNLKNDPESIKDTPNTLLPAQARKQFVTT